MALEILGRVEEGITQISSAGPEIWKPPRNLSEELQGEQTKFRESTMCRGIKALESYSLYTWKSAQCYVA